MEGCLVAGWTGFGRRPVAQGLWQGRRVYACLVIRCLHVLWGRVGRIVAADWNISRLLPARNSIDHGQLDNGATNDAYSPGLVLWRAVADPSAAVITLDGASKPTEGSFQFAVSKKPGARFSETAHGRISGDIDWSGQNE